MLIATSRFGEVEIMEESIITFQLGIPGFRKSNRYVLIQPYEDIPIHYMQSLDEPELAFLVVNPFEFYPNYEITLSDEMKESLDLQSDEEVAVWCIVSVLDKLEEATMNLLAPLVINTRSKKGDQVILVDSRYQIKHPLFMAQAKHMRED